MVVLGFVLHSCVHDDVISSSDPPLIYSKEYTSKSLWKEDETYIKNVMKVYHENEAQIKKVNGIPLWDYAMTMGYTDESFLVVPVANGKDIVACIEVPRYGDQITFVYDNNKEHLKFFQGYTTAKKRKPVEQTREQSSMAGRLKLCSVTVVEMWYPDNENEPNGSGHWEVTGYITKCDEMQGGDGPSNPNPQGPTYPYPGGGGTQSQPQTPCAKLKIQNNDATYKAKVDYLKTKTGESFEYGFRVNNPPPGQTATQYQQLSNVVGSNTIDFKFFNTTYGYMHSHHERLIPIFSPDDINTFIKLLINANNNGIPQENVFMNVVNPDGTVYQLRGDGIDVASLSIFDQNTIDTELNKKYVNDYDLAKANQSPEFYQKNFLKFMRDKMNINGAKMYSIDSNGKSSQISLNGNSLANPIPCP